MYKINFKYEALLPLIGSLLFFDSFIGLLFLLSIILIYLRFINFSLSLENDHLLVKKGLWTKSEEKIFFNKINKINLHQNPIQKLFKVYSITLETGNEQNRHFHSILDGKDLIDKLNLKIKP